jgi:hypothetical protein
MPDPRLLEILSQLQSDPEGVGEAKRLCDVSAEVMGLTGAGIVLMMDESPNTSVCSSNSVSATIEELQFITGEGPCVDAVSEGRPVLEPDLANPELNFPPSTGHLSSHS